VENFYGFHNDVWALSLTDSPTWTVLTPSGTPPDGRAYHSAIYDPVRDRMLVFGGWPGGNFYNNDVWALSLGDAPAWTALEPLGPVPPVRQHHSAIYDPVRDRMVVFGGSNADGVLGDAFALRLADAPSAWVALNATGTPPTAREEHSAVYDPVGDRMVVFGGRNAAGVNLNDTWTLSLPDTVLSWTALTPAGTPPVARVLHSAIYDPARDRMVVFGGLNASQFRSDLWELSLAGGTAWSALVPGGVIPSARDGHCAVYVGAQDRMVMYGGYGGAARYQTDAWAFAFSPTALSVNRGPIVNILGPVFPNPSAGDVRVDFSIARAGHVQVAVFDEWETGASTAGRGPCPGNDGGLDGVAGLRGHGRRVLRPTALSGGTRRKGAAPEVTAPLAAAGARDGQSPIATSAAGANVSSIVTYSDGKPLLAVWNK
jgi:hypothetical protein